MAVAKLTKQQINGVQSALNHLLPGCDVSVQVMDRNEFLELHTPDQFHRRSGKKIDAHEALIWVKLPGDRIGVFSVSRRLIPFSDAKKNLLWHFTETIGDIQFVANESRIQQAELMANAHAFERMLVAHLLRGKIQDDSRENTDRDLSFWAPSLIIGQLQDLALKRYEGQPSTSGFVVASKPEQYLRDQVGPSNFEFEAFPDDIFLQEQFFEQTASHRYIDGRNAFYLIDHHLRVHGALRHAQPMQNDWISHAANEHLEPLFGADASTVWIGYVGNNEDINAVVTKSIHLRWLKSHWHFVDRYDLSYALQQQNFAEAQIEDLVAILLAVSETRRGALVLIPDEKDHLPETVGYIDESRLGTTLHESLMGRGISELRRKHMAVGMFTSDGMTTIDKSGCILGCGEIVRIESMREEQQRAGGGRTQAALTASQYGLVIKISADGPISFYKEGREQIRIVF